MDAVAGARMKIGASKTATATAPKDAPAKAETPKAGTPLKVVRVLPLKVIRVRREVNSRKRIYDSDVAALGGSMRRVGQIHPSVVRPLTKEEQGKTPHEYELVAGEQRYLAVWRQTDGEGSLECTVWEMTERQADDINFDENTFRYNLNLYDIMQRCLRRREKWGESIDEMAERTDISERDLGRFFRIQDKVAPDLIDRLRVDARAEVLDRLDQASRIDGVSARDRHERQQKWWAAEGWNQVRKVARDARRSRRIRLLRARRAADLIETTRQIMSPEGTFALTMAQARAVANALRWAVNPDDYPSPYKE